MGLIALALAADLIARAIRARHDAAAEAAHGVRAADRYLAWARRHGTPEQAAHAQQLADAWHAYWHSL